MHSLNWKGFVEYRQIFWAAEIFPLNRNDNILRCMHHGQLYKQWTGLPARALESAGMFGL